MLVIIISSLQISTRYFSMDFTYFKEPARRQCRIAEWIDRIQTQNNYCYLEFIHLIPIRHYLLVVTDSYNVRIYSVRVLISTLTDEPNIHIAKSHALLSSKVPLACCLFGRGNNVNPSRLCSTIGNNAFLLHLWIIIHSCPWHVQSHQIFMKY